MTFLYQKKKKTQNNGKPGGEPVGGNKEQPSRIHIILLLAVTRWYRLASPALSSSIPPSSPTSPLLIPAFISLHSPTFHSMEIRGSHKPAWSRGKVKRTERTRQRRQRQTGKRIFIYVCETAANAGEKTTTWDLFFSHRTTTKYCKLHCNHSQSCSENLMVITEYDCKTINAHLKHLLS